MINFVKRVILRKKPTYISTISRVIIDNAFAAIILVNKKGKVLEWNRKAEVLFGWSTEEATDNSILKLLIPKRYHSKFSLDVKQFFKDKTSNIIGKETILTVRHKDGYEFRAALRLNHVVSKGEDVFVVLLSDKSMDQKIEEERVDYANQLNGRIRTVMSVIQSMIKQTLVTADPEEVGSLLSRLFVMDKAVNLLYQTNWHTANLYNLVYDTTYIYGSFKQFSIRGDTDFNIRGNDAISFALIIHELSTNSIKYGALGKTCKKGKVDVSWELKDNTLVWHWLESGGPKVKAPEEIGFGIQFIKRAFTGQGTTIIEYLDTGLSCTIVLKLDSIEV